jgi:hypothetical protein
VHAAGDSDSNEAGPVAFESSPAPLPMFVNRTNIDRVQVARELASLGFEDSPFGPQPVIRPSGETDQSDALKRLARDESISKSLLLRLIDGVKGA